MRSSLATERAAGLRRRKLQLSLQRAFALGILEAVGRAVDAGDPEAESFRQELARLNDDEERRSLGPWTGGVTPAEER